MAVRRSRPGREREGEGLIQEDLTASAHDTLRLYTLPKILNLLAQLCFDATPKCEDSDVGRHDLRFTTPRKIRAYDPTAPNRSSSLFVSLVLSSLLDPNSKEKGRSERVVLFDVFDVLFDVRRRFERQTFRRRADDHLRLS